MKAFFWEEDLLLDHEYRNRMQERKEQILSLSDWTIGDVEELLRMNIVYLEEHKELTIPSAVIAMICFDARCPDEDSERLQRVLDAQERYVTLTHILI